MTIGKRKGSAAKGVGGTGTNNVNKVGGSLSKNDHWYIQQAFGMLVDPGAGIPGPQSATGGIKTVMNDKTIHTFIATGSLVCNPNFDKDVEYVVIGGAGGGGAS